MLEFVPEHVLIRLAEQNGPDSYEAETLAKLRARRAKDEQVHCFRIDQSYTIGPMPDANTELQITLANELAKRLNREL